MGIREWYGCKGPYTPSSEADSAFDIVLTLYHRALCEYVGIANAKDIDEWLDLARSRCYEDLGKSMLIEWVESKGVGQLKSLVNRNLPDDADAVLQLDFEKCILESELDLKYPEELRAALIRIVTDMSAKCNAIDEHDQSVIQAKSPWNDWKAPPLAEDGFKISAYTSILLTESQYGAPLYIC